MQEFFQNFSQVICKKTGFFSKISTIQNACSLFARTYIRFQCLYPHTSPQNKTARTVPHPGCSLSFMSLLKSLAEFAAAGGEPWFNQFFGAIRPRTFTTFNFLRRQGRRPRRFARLKLAAKPLTSRRGNSFAPSISIGRVPKRSCGAFGICVAERRHRQGLALSGGFAGNW